MNKKKCLILCGIFTTISLGYNVLVANASSDIEQEFNQLIKEYNNEDVIVENGISLNIGEKLDLSSTKGWKSFNENVVEVDENGIVKAVNSGTTFISNKINEKVHIIEIYVPKNTKITRMNLKSQSVDRDYYKVFIDPGHGGNDNGASGNGYYEDVLNLQVAKRVESKLKSKGIDVKMSRTSDVYIGLYERAEMANNYGADAFISIHQNSASSTSANGIETYYHTDKINYKGYADKIQTESISQTGARNRGTKDANFVVIRESNMPSALFECGFISNKQESQKLASEWYQEKLASAIADSIEVYLKNNIKLSQPQDGIAYQTHIQDYGWQNLRYNGQLSGTEGESKRLESIKIKLNNILPGASIKYRTHIQDIGWQDWKSDGEISGTEGQSKRLEAIEIRLENAPGYNVEYRTHVQDIGWQDWVSNGEISGTVGKGKRLEAIEIRVVKYPTIQYRTHVQDYGWQNWVSNGEISGTQGESKRLEGIQIILDGLPIGSKLSYQTHVQDYGWQNWVSNGEISGTEGQSKRLEAIKIKLENAPGYSIKYRTHIQDYGWQDWVSNGEISGTVGEGKRLEAIEIKIINNSYK